MARSVVLLGPPGGGRTGVTAALTAWAGSPGAPLHTTTGLAASELRPGVTLLDVPVDPDLVAGLAAGLRTADAAVLVVSAGSGLDARTALLWDECEQAGLPRIVAVTGLDAGGADLDDVVAICQRVLGAGVQPLALPVHADDGGVAGVLDLLTLRLHDWSGGTPQNRDPDPEHLQLVAPRHADLVELLLAGSPDDALLDRYLDDDVLPPTKALRGELARAVVEGSVQPVLPVLTGGPGTAELIDLLDLVLPGCPPHRVPPLTGANAVPVEPDSGGPAVAEVLGRLTDGGMLLRVLAGALHEGQQLGEVAVRGLRTSAGPSSPCAVGVVCAVDGTACTGTLLSDEPLSAAPWDVPEPLHPVAVRPGAAVATALAGAVDGDPGLRLELSAGTGQLLLWSQGPQHAASTLARLGHPEVEPVRALVLHQGGRPLEPWLRVEVDVPTPLAAPVAAALRTHRAASAVPMPAADRPGHSTVVADVPQSALPSLAPALRTASRGTARAVRHPAGWGPTTT